MHFLDYFAISHTFFKIFDYQVSYIEFIGTLFGLVSVWLATKANIYTWHTGIINQIAFFLIFYQVQLYFDMILQVYFTYVCIYGWIFWKKPNDQKHAISFMKSKNRLYLFAILLIIIILLGTISPKLPHYLPHIFTKPSAYPFADAFISASSIAACFLMARKRIEAWVLWILVDFLSIFTYSLKGVVLIAGEYIIFLIMAIYGLLNWIKIYKDEKRLGSRQVYATA